MLPISRTEGVTIKRMGDEAVVFDSTTGNVHHLNRVAEIVWRSCDGRTDTAGLERIVSRVTNVADAGPAVELALEQLSSRGLLMTNVSRASAEKRRSRRDALKQLAAAAAIPIIITCTASRARAQAFSPGQPCSGICRTFGPDPSPGVPGPIIDVYYPGVIGYDGTCVVDCPPGYFRVG